MNNIRLLISLVRANPGYAAIALVLDVSIGAIAATTIYLLLNAANVTPQSQWVLVFGSILAVVGIFGVGYTLLLRRFGVGEGNYWLNAETHGGASDDGFDGNHDNWMEDDAHED